MESPVPCGTPMYADILSVLLKENIPKVETTCGLKDIREDKMWMVMDIYFKYFYWINILRLF